MRSDDCSYGLHQYCAPCDCDCHAPTNHLDVTERVTVRLIVENLGVTTCVCGAKDISSYGRHLFTDEQEPVVMECCGARLYATTTVRVFQVNDKEPHG